MPASAGAAKRVRIPPRTGPSLSRTIEGQETFIAIFTSASICTYLISRYVLNSNRAVIALYAALLLGGVPLVARLLGKAIKFDFGSDLLAGFSIVTAVLLREYLVATIIVLMLSGGTALERYATRRASAVLGALGKRMPTIAHRAST